MTEQRRVTILLRKDETERNSVTPLELDYNDPAKSSYLCHSISQPFPHALVMDHFCNQDFLKLLNKTRLSLPLDSKRPTCDRRFFCDQDRTLVSILESIVRKGLLEGFGSQCKILTCSASDVVETNHVNNTIQMHTVFINKYIRILEYTRPGVELLPHSDGSKICDETGYKSTHTLLLFLSHCEEGGETLLMDDSNNYWSKQKGLKLNETHRFQHPVENEFQGLYRRSIILDYIRPSDQHVILGVQPTIGRIFLFPHTWAHAGALCQSIPKIVLRAEITLIGDHKLALQV